MLIGADLDEQIDNGTMDFPAFDIFVSFQVLYSYFKQIKFVSEVTLTNNFP